MLTAKHYRRGLNTVSNLLVLLATLLSVGWAAVGACAQTLPGRAATADEARTINEASALIHTKKVVPYDALCGQLIAQGRIRPAVADDPWLKEAEASGGTPFAYTMPDDAHPHQPLAIVLAPRFFTATTPAARGSILVHELGHWMAFVKRGSSTEYDGYKAEFDTHKQIGLTDTGGLTYYMMCDGVVEYVVPRDKTYAKDPEIIAYQKL